MKKIIILAVLLFSTSAQADWIKDRMPVDMNEGNIKSLYEVGRSVAYDCEFYLKRKSISEAGLKDACHNHIMINNTLTDWQIQYPKIYRQILLDLINDDYGFELAFGKYTDRTNNVTMLMTLNFAKLKAILN